MHLSKWLFRIMVSHLRMRVSRREQKNRKKAVGAAVAEVRRLGELDNGHTRKQPNSFAFMLEWFFLCGGFVAAGSLPSASSLPDGLVPQSQELTDVARRTARTGCTGSGML